MCLYWRGVFKVHSVRRIISLCDGNPSISLYKHTMRTQTTRVSLYNFLQVKVNLYLQVHECVNSLNRGEQRRHCDVTLCIPVEMHWRLAGGSAWFLLSSSLAHFPTLKVKTLHTWIRPLPFRVHYKSFTTITSFDAIDSLRFIAVTQTTKRQILFFYI
jgi:hypothetical protein